MEGVGFQLVALLVVGLVILLSVFRKFYHGHAPTAQEAVRAAFALLALASGILASIVFLLTNPPAIEKLSEEARALVGVVTLIITCAFGWREVRAVFFDD